ncbi:MAG TPA: tyrosine-type recombinase/integrase [Candidatus Dormibacteraeota bacterium]
MASRRGPGEGSIFQRKKDKRWVGQLDLGYVDTPQGRRRRYKTVYGTSRKEVAERLTKLLRDRQTGMLPTAGPITLGDYLSTWLANRERSLKPSTFRNYSGIVDHHLIPELGRIRLERLRAEDVDAMLQRRLKAGSSAARVHDLRSVLRAALGPAVQRRLVTFNAAELTDPVRQDERRVTSLQPEEARQFLDSLQGDRLEALYRVALAVGLRRGEALGLRWEDVDLDARRLRVRYALQRVKGQLVLIDPKTKKSGREVVLPEAVVAALREHRRRQLEEQLLAGGRWVDSVPIYSVSDGRVSGTTSGLVFRTTIGTPLDGSMVTAAFHAALGRAGVRQVRFHDLRHSCASLLLAQGVPARVVMEVLGHSSITLTLNTYSHVMPTLMDDAAAAMDRALRPS